MLQIRTVIMTALSLASLLNIQRGAADIKEDHVLMAVVFAQTHAPSVEVMFEYDEDEICHVDEDKRQMIWRLPEFGQAITVDIKDALPIIDATKASFNVLIQRSNHTQAANEAPEVTVFPKEPVELGQPNMLICHIDKFFPPVLNVMWLRNGHLVTEGVTESIFLPSTEFRFHKFHYLTFLPTADDVYDCKVEHWGLEQPLLTHWEAQEPIQMPETTETVVCALGLLVGLVGIVVGTILIIQALRSSHDPRPRGPL